MMPESGVRDQIDIKLAIKALPNKIMNYSLENVDMFNFRIFQESLQAYQNHEIVKAFEFFDDKNKDRVQGVKNKLLYQRDTIEDASSLLAEVREKIDYKLNQAQQMGVARPSVASEEVKGENSLMR